MGEVGLQELSPHLERIELLAFAVNQVMLTFLLTGTTSASNMASYDMSLDAIWNRRH